MVMRACEIEQLQKQCFVSVALFLQLFGLSCIREKVYSGKNVFGKKVIREKGYSGKVYSGN